MIHITSNQLLLWLTSFIWPLTRILGLIAVAPVFGSSSVPVRIKITFGIVLAIVIAPALPPTPQIDPLSLRGMIIVLEQFIIGVAMGFTMQIIFGCIDLAGSLISMAMGLGFASFFDPQTHASTPAVSQFLTLVATMLFLSLNLHLVLLATLAESFTTLPIGTSLMNQPGIWLHIANSASVIFNSGVQISLPIIAALLVTNVALGILTKAAPQLNIFGIGFPVTITVGFVMLFIIMPYLIAPFQRILELGVGQAALRKPW